VNLYVDEDGHLLTPLTRLQKLEELKLLGIQSISLTIHIHDFIYLIIYQRDVI
jgi:hypothetical protein